MTSYYIWCDGAIVPRNPGGHAVGGWVVKKGLEHTPVCKGNEDLGEKPENTNNMAEYCAVLGALQDLVDKGLAGHDVNVIIRTDSKLVVEQLNDRWNCNNPVLRKYRDKIWVTMLQFEDVVIEWVPREENVEADTQSRALYGV